MFINYGNMYSPQNYFEELVTVKDGQLSQLQSQLHKQSKESESQQRQLEAIILELQQQLYVDRVALYTCTNFY